MWPYLPRLARLRLWLHTHLLRHTVHGGPPDPWWRLRCQCGAAFEAVH